MKIRSVLLASLGALALTACGDNAKSYEQSPDTVKSLIKTVTLPTALIGRSVAGRRIRQPSDDITVIEMLNRAGEEKMRIVVQVTSDGSGSKVVAQAQTPDGETIDGQAGQMNGRLAQKFADELVASAIEKRPFDMMFASGPGVQAMFGSNTALGKEVQKANKRAAAISQMEQQIMERERREKFESEYGEGWGEDAYQN